jgi:parallel beta-helix repeat protein
MSLLYTASSLAQNTIRIPADAPTIQAAIDAAQNGDTVLVSPGTYNENLNFEGKAITVTSGAKTYADAAATIINGATDGPVVVFASNEPATAVLNGFTVQNGHASLASGLNGGGISISNSSPTITNNIVTNNIGCGVFVYNNASPLIEGNDIKQSRGPGAALGSSCLVSHPGAGANPGTGLAIVYAGNVQVIGNTIEDNAFDTDPNGSTPCDSPGVAILSGSEVLLQNNIIRNNAGDCGGGFEDSIGAPIAKLILIQNLIYGNTHTADGGGATQVSISGTFSPPYPSVTEINNTIYVLGQELVLSFGPSTIANNIFVNTATSQNYKEYSLWCADVEAQNSPLNIINNDTFNVGAMVLSGCPLGNGNLSFDPFFRGPASGNFHLQPSSSVIAAGDLNAPDIPSTDLGGKARTVCDTIDMGAYEFHPHPPIVLTSSNNPAPGGSSITFNAQLTGNCNVPSGTVTFLDGTAAIGAGTLDNLGTARMTTSFLVVGQHNITASYPGDFNFGKSTSSTLVQTITGDPTSTTLTISPNPATAFFPITLMSLVTSPYGMPNGSVVFTTGNTTLATASLNASGSATATISSLGAGTYNITANYQATTLFHASSSIPAQETVLGAASATTLTASPNPVTATQAVTFTAQVHSVQGTQVPTGQITWTDGTTILGSTTLDPIGSSSLSLSTLSVGAHAITAHYDGSVDFNPSDATVSETVILIGTALTLTASPNPANNGQTVTLTASATSGILGVVPSGVITFMDGLNILGTSSLSNGGTVSFTTASLATGSHSLHAMLAPNATFAGSTSSVVNEVVQAYDFTISLSQGSLTLPSGDWALISATVTPVGGFNGTVLLSCSGVPNHTQCDFPSGNQVSLADGAKTIQLAINTSDVYGYGQLVSHTTPFSKNGGKWPLLAALLFPALSLFERSSRKRTMLRFLFIVWITALALAAMLCMQSCSDKLPAKTAPGTYDISVTGTSTEGTSFKHTSPLELVVTP